MTNGAGPNRAFNTGNDSIEGNTPPGGLAASFDVMVRTNVTSTSPTPLVSQNAARWRWTYILFAGLLMLTPLVAMQFTSEVVWTPGDFLIFAVMLAGLGLLLEGASRIGHNATTRAWLMAGAVAIFLAIWAELAVGIFS